MCRSQSLWLPSQNGKFLDLVQRQKARLSALDDSPFSSITSQVPLTNKGPSGIRRIFMVDGFSPEWFACSFMLRAPLGHFFTCEMIFSFSASSIFIQGRRSGSNTFGRPFTQIPECMHNSGFQTTVISSFEYSLRPMLSNFTDTAASGSAAVHFFRIAPVKHTTASAHPAT